MTRSDLLVLGGGPAGATLAALAAGAGLDVTVVERARFPRNKVCGEFVSVEGCGVLARLGLLDRLRDEGARGMDRCLLTDRRGARLEVALPVTEAAHAALGFSRARLDAILLDVARTRGARVRERHEAVRPILENGRVAGLVVRRVGEPDRELVLRAPVVAAADGRRSLLLRALHPSLGDPATTHDDSWFGLETRLPDSIADRRAVELHLFDGGYVGVAPVEGGRINVCMLVRVAALRACGGRPERLLRERLARNPAVRESLGRVRDADGWRSVGPLRFAARRPTSHGALFLGDAAGTIDPFCGLGIAHALRAAELALPAVISAVEQGGLPDAVACRYDTAWRESFAGATRRARALGLLLGRDRLASGALALLRGPGRPLARGLVAATRNPSAHGTGEVQPG